MYEPGVLDLADSHFIDHIASPDIFIDHDAKQIRLYFHGRTGSKPDGSQIQGTRVAVSADGLQFTVREPNIGPAYFRVFRHGGECYALARSAELLHSPDGFRPFRSLGIPRGMPENIRHVAVWRRDETTLTVFHTVIGEAPEVIYACAFHTKGAPADWWAEESVEVLRPERDYEGADLPLAPSEGGAIDIGVNQLRDPDILVDADGSIYMPYSVAGEAGIAMTRVTIEQAID